MGISPVLHQSKRQFKIIRKRFFHRVKLAAHFYTRRSEKEPVFVIATKRSGSNLLISYLNSIPGVAFLPEILNPDMSYGLRRRWISRAAVLRHIVHSIHYTPTRICGAKLIFMCLQRHGLVLEDLKAAFPNARFIVLYRESLIDQFISFKAAEFTGQWVWTPDYRVPPPFRFDREEFGRFRRRIEGLYRDVFKSIWLRDRSVVLSYEELTRDAQGIFEEHIFPLLGVPASPVFTEMRKQNTRPLSEAVENYGEIEEECQSGAFRRRYAFFHPEESTRGIPEPAGFYSRRP
ncbi:MAG: sulfotransferase [Candidatus Omnitrophica bacterium]|nr:sulfotransferase [Candidatus Omnitrophota bacterium]